MTGEALNCAETKKKMSVKNDEKSLFSFFSFCFRRMRKEMIEEIIEIGIKWLKIKKEKKTFIQT